VRVFVPRGVVLLGLDEHLERRRGERIAARGVYRDAARSSKAYVNKASGLRWLSLMLLAPLSWADRVWALPFFTVLAPSARYHEERGQRHKTLADHARQMLLQVRRWLPERELVGVADSTYAVMALLAAYQKGPHPVTCVTRFRLDAALYLPAPPRLPGQRGRSRKKGDRLPTLEQRLADPKTPWASSPCLAGTAKARARWKSSPAPPCGITRESRWSPCGGC